MCTLKHLRFAFCASESEHGISHAGFVFLIPSLIKLLQQKDQSKNVFPFETRPINTWIFFTALCIYCLSLATKMEIQTHWASYSQILANVLFISKHLHQRHWLQSFCHNFMAGYFSSYGLFCIFFFFSSFLIGGFSAYYYCKPLSYVYIQVDFPKNYGGNLLHT